MQMRDARSRRLDAPDISIVRGSETVLRRVGLTRFPYGAILYSRGAKLARSLILMQMPRGTG